MHTLESIPIVLGHEISPGIVLCAYERDEPYRDETWHFGRNLVTCETLVGDDRRAFGLMLCAVMKQAETMLFPDIGHDRPTMLDHADVD